MEELRFGSHMHATALPLHSLDCVTITTLPVVSVKWSLPGREVVKIK